MGGGKRGRCLRCVPTGRPAAEGQPPRERRLPRGVHQTLHAAEGIPPEERVRLQWSRLEPQNGWIYAYRIKIPESELRPMDRPGIPEETYWHPAPKHGMTTEYTVLIGPHDMEQGPYPGVGVGALFLMGVTARNGDRVALMVHETTGSPETAAALDEMRAHTVNLIRAEGRSGWRNQRAVIPTPDRHGVGTAVELALPDDVREVEIV